MIDLQYEMTFAERIEGPLGPTTRSPARLCWKIAEATLAGPRITASLAMPGTDWILVRRGGCGGAAWLPGPAAAGGWRAGGHPGCRAGPRPGGAGPGRPADQP